MVCFGFEPTAAMMVGADNTTEHEIITNKANTNFT